MFALYFIYNKEPGHTRDFIDLPVCMFGNVIVLNMETVCKNLAYVLWL